MRYFRVHAYNASLSELWRFSGKNPWTFLVAILLKLARSERLELENPDPSSRRIVSFDEVPAEARAALKPYPEAITACGYRAASVYRLESDASVTFGLMFIGPREDRYIPLFASMSKYGAHPTGAIRFFIVSFDEDFVAIVTSRFEPQFDPSPATVYIYEPGLSVEALDKIHSRELREHARPVIPITSGNVDDLTARLEETSYEHLHSRGIYSEKYEKPEQT